MRFTETDELIVKVTGSTGTAGTPSTGVLTVQGITAGTPIIVGGNVAAAATDSGNPVKAGGVYNTTFPTYTNGQRGDLQQDARGALAVSLFSGGTQVSSSTVSANSNGNVLALNVNNKNQIFNGSSWDREAKPNTTARLLSSANTTNATNVKASSGDLFRIRGHNAKASAVYLKLYNKATAPTVGTDTPVMTHYLPASSTFDITFSDPYYFATGIGYGLTLAAADADTTAVLAGDILCMNVVYQ